MINISRLSASFKLLRHRRQAKALQSIHSVGQFRAAIERERARADRNGHQFSVVLLHIDNLEPDSAQLTYLTQTLANRIRLTDEVGWFDNEHIGVVLPCTSAAGAQRLADDICEAVATGAISLKCNIYTYPSNWFSNGKGHSAQLHFADLFPEWNPTRPPLLSTCARHDDHDDEGKITLTEEQPPDDTILNCLASMKKLETILVRKLLAWKRGMDIAGALFGLVVLSPILLLMVVIIKIVSPGPVLFKQPRVGCMGRIFGMWKFRTMRIDADPSNHRQHVVNLINGRNSKMPMTKLDHDPQIIPFGRMLRQTCLDELPQLINVLRGEMSLVGPRPPIPYEVEKYLHWHNERMHILPGMTGLWQVSGKNRLTFKQMVRLDIQYARQQSLWLDIKILLKTPFAIAMQIWDSLLNQQPLDEEVV